MAYYQITKEQLVSFYTKNVATFHILPNSYSNPLNFQRMNHFVSFQSPLFEDISKNLQQYNNKIIKELSPKINNYFLQSFNALQNDSNNPKFIHFSNLLAKLQFATPNEENNDYNIKVYSKITAPDNISLITNIEEILNLNIMAETHAKDEFTSNFTHQYLFNQEKLDNFQRISSYFDNKIQTSLIHIDFGTENEISLDPILNMSGLNQAFVAHYLDNQEYLIYSDSPRNLIEQHLGKVEVASEENIFKIMDNSAILDYISLKGLEDISNYQIDNNTIEIKEMDIFEESLFLMSSNSISTQETLPLLLKLLHKYQTEKLERTHKPFVEQAIDYMVGKAKEDPETFQQEYIRFLKELFQIKNYEMLNFFTPDSKIIGDKLLPHLPVNFFESLLENITLVEAASLFFNNDKRYQVLNSFTKASQKVIDNGYSLSISEFATLSKNGRDIVQNILTKIKKGDSDIYNQFKSDPIYNTIQQDIFPLLSLADKLKYNNYSCFHQATNKLNKIDHTISIPLVLFDDPIIAQNVFDKYMQHSQNNINFRDDYFPMVAAYTFSNELDKALNNNTKINFHQLLFSNKYLLKQTLEELLTKGNQDELLSKLLKQNEKFPDDTTIVHFLHHFTIKFLTEKQFCETPVDHKTLLKLNPFIVNIDYDTKKQTKRLLLNCLFNDPSFKEDEHFDFILQFYKEDNSCFGSRSSSRVKKFFRSSEVIEQIINYHKEHKTISQADGYNISNGFQSSSSWSSIFTKASIKQLHQFNLDVVHICPDLIYELPAEIMNDEEIWKDKLHTLIHLKGKSGENAPHIRLPEVLQKSYSFFKHVLEQALKVNSEQGSIQFLRQFPKHFINKQENMLKIFELLSSLYKESSHYSSNSTAFDKIKKMNPELSTVVDTINRKSHQDKHNYFENVLIKIQEEQLNKNIITSDKVVNKVHKF